VEVSRTTHLTQRLEQHLFESKLLREIIGQKALPFTFHTDLVHLIREYQVPVTVPKASSQRQIANRECTA
jgi:hypothetical protein